MAEKHALFTGPTRRFGNRVTLSDGREIDVAAPVIYLDTEEDAAEVAHQIALGHVEHGHPDDVENDKSGKPVQRKFAYDDSHHKAHARGKKG